MLNGKHVIVDDTNLSEKNLERLKQLAQKVAKDTNTQIKVEVKEFLISLEEAISRDQKRENPVGNTNYQLNCALNSFTKIS